MNKTEQVKLNEIAKLFRDYYKKHLDDEYLFKTILYEDETSMIIIKHTRG